MQITLLEQTKKSHEEKSGLRPIPMRDDPFYSSKSGIARARYHLNDLHLQTLAFHNSKPYATVTEVDPKTGEQVYKVKLIKPMPVHLENIVADAFNNLRNALDQAVFGLGKKKGYFPIRDTEAEFERAMGELRKKLPPEICKLVVKFKPYKTGNDHLWALNKISGTNKHGIIRPVGIYTGDVHVKSGWIGGPGGGTVGNPGWDRDKNELVIARVRSGGEFHMNFHFTPHIALNDVEIVDGQPVEGVLSYLIGIVEGIVMAFEAEAKRIGLIRT
jgi:hypothetical protein